MIVPYKNIPTYNADEDIWGKTSFSSQKEFGEFLMKNCFKEPGEYGFNESTKKWNEHSKRFTEKKYYTEHVEGSKEYYEFWDWEKLKNRLGVIWKSEDKIWYLARDYYFLLNYLPITNKEKGNIESFMTIRDVQYHMMLYEKLAEIFHKHSPILKRRQMAYSICNSAKCLNYFWFENDKTIKIFASDEKFIDDKKGTWKIINSYIDFLNKSTAWYRPILGSYPSIQQVEKIKFNNRWYDEGNKSVIVAITTKKDPKAGVGGATTIAWFEEGGIAPTADETLQYMAPAIEIGTEEKSGSFVLGGSVGDLDESKPLQLMIENPDVYDAFGVPTKWFDESKEEKICGLFIPAQYGLPEATDEYGNTIISLALKYLDKQEEQWKKLPPEQYALRKSQNPRTIREAFRSRKVGEFASAFKLMQNQQERIQTKSKENLWEFKPLKGLLEENRDGKIELKSHPEIKEHEYPIIKTSEDKRGCVTIYELPIEENPKFFTYFAGVDPIEADVTSTSSSVASVDIFRKAHKIKYKDKDGKEKTRIEGDKLVAIYRGRFDTAEKTNEQIWYLIKMYNAFTLAERSKPNFINYMRRNGRERYLAKESDIPLFKDQNINNIFNTTSQFGFTIPPNKKESVLWKFFKSEFKSYLSTEYSFTYNNDGEVLRIFRGVDRIDDYWLLEEALQYIEEDGKNYDRLSSFFPALALCKIYETLTGISTVYEVSEEERKKQEIEKQLRTKNSNNQSFSLLGGYGNQIYTKRNKPISLI